MKETEIWSTQKKIVYKICDKYNITYDTTETVVENGSTIYSGSKWFTNLCKIKRPMINKSANIRQAIKDIEDDNMIIIKKVDGKSYQS